jgi:uncharacterized protein YidB (DUF937 family)
MDVILGGLTGSSPLSKILSGKNSAILLVLAPVLLAYLGKKDKKGKSGLDNLVEMFGENGLGDIVGSWIGTGPNKPITKTKVKKAGKKKLIPDLAKESGLSEDQVATGLTDLLPTVVNELSPKGSAPQGSGLDSAISMLSGLLK